VPHRTIVCRCEDLTLQDIRDIISAGMTTMEEVKRLTRCGMGPCQGRTCGATVAAEIARATGTPIEDVAPPTFRPPIKPVKFALFLRTEAPDDMPRVSVQLASPGDPAGDAVRGGRDHA
jgi:bacterioferritin-associated ferredoxin